MMTLLCCSPLWAGGLRALNRGHFIVNYRLAQSGEWIKAEEVSVKVTNRAEYFEKPTEALRGHEEGHRRINEAESRRMEAELEKFEIKGAAGIKNMRAAERAFRARFMERVKQAEGLHQAWDETARVPPPR